MKCGGLDIASSHRLFSAANSPDERGPRVLRVLGLLDRIGRPAAAARPHGEATTKRPCRRAGAGGQQEETEERMGEEEQEESSCNTPQRQPPGRVNATAVRQSSGGRAQRIGEETQENSSCKTPPRQPHVDSVSNPTAVNNRRTHRRSWVFLVHAAARLRSADIFRPASSSFSSH